MSDRRRSPVRLAAALGAAALAVLLAVVLTTPGRAATPSGCSGTITAGSATGIQLRGDELHVTAVSCDRGRTVVRAYLRTKVDQSSERCATDAENPGHAGCRVDGWLCHSTGRVQLSHGLSIHPEACVEGRGRIAFSEADRTRG